MESKQELIENAIEELKKIKIYSTDLEWDELIKNIDNLDGDDVHQCVYGIMTGSCYSKRAVELIQKCVNNNTFYTSLSASQYNSKVNYMNKDNSCLGRNFTSLERLLEDDKDMVVQIIKELYEE